MALFRGSRVCANKLDLARIAFNYSTGKEISDKLTPQEKITHTGQCWSPDDYRMVRFIDKPKQINERFAIDLIAQVPPQAVKGRHTWCNGGGGPLGHPKVYINLDEPGAHACGYCGLRFFQEHGH